MDYYNFDAWGYICNSFVPQYLPTPQNEKYFTFDSARFYTNFSALTLNLLQNFYNVTVVLADTIFHHLHDYTTISINIKNCNSNVKSTVYITECHFENTSSLQSISMIYINK